MALRLQVSYASSEFQLSAPTYFTVIIMADGIKKLDVPSELLLSGDLTPVNYILFNRNTQGMDGANNHAVGTLLLLSVIVSHALP